MDRDIDNLQHQIDELNKLFMETAGEDAAVSKKEEQLGILLLKLQDRALEPRFLNRLEKWLLADSKAREYYVQFMHLSAMLYSHFRSDRSRQIAELATRS